MSHALRLHGERRDELLWDTRPCTYRRRACCLPVRLDNDGLCVVVDIATKAKQVVSVVVRIGLRFVTASRLVCRTRVGTVK